MQGRIVGLGGDVVTFRYVAGISVDNGVPSGHIIRLDENEDGSRNSAGILASDMTHEQVEHLHMQLGVLMAALKPKGEAS